DRFNTLCSLPSGEVLGAFGDSLFRLEFTDDEVTSTRLTEFDYLQLDVINLLYVSSTGHLFIGDRAGRLVIFKHNGTNWQKLKDEPSFGVCNDLVVDPAEEFLWYVNEQSLGKIDLQDLRFTEVAKDLPAPNLLNGELDSSGNLWLTSSNGLIRYETATNTAHRFDRADGLLSTSFTREAALTVPTTGEIWIGGREGVNIFKPEEITLDTAKPNISIAEFLVNDLPFVPTAAEHKGNINEKASLALPYRDNTLSFRFTALDYSNPSANEYYYQLEGYDDSRVFAGTRNFVRYPNLPAGDYQFKIWATNSDKVLNPIPKVLGITIIPPIYQRTWFYLLCLLLISGIIYAIFQYRLEQALKVERLRVKISSDLHDDVGGMLSGLAMQTELLELTATEETKPKLARVAAMSRSAMSRMRDTVWAIDARKDTLEDLMDRMREHAEETLTPRNIQYSINAGSLNPKRKLATDVRQSLYLIYKEAVTNIAKHSNGDTANVELRDEAGRIALRIHDNGKVKAKNYKTTGAGQRNMQMRAASIGAVLLVETSDGFKIEVKPMLG
ncbi:MAG: triple tyrosine motif-containing protein, partial [Bacteroidota bacterium]